ncbi:kinase-like protein, partial [Fragilariopsis cylindrus CCMP1102]
PQSFSHFTYEKSKRYFMVVDLQGVLAINPVDGTKCYKLTDPVIHKRRKKKKEKLRKYTFGRTDRGEKGMKAFFHTHQCNDLCRLLGL